MTPHRPYRRLRLKLRPSGGDMAPMSDQAVIGLTFSYLFGLGATLVLVTLALPHPADRELLGLVIPAALAYGVAGTAFVARERIPLWLYRAFPVCGTLLAAAVVYSAGAALIGVYSLLFFWVVVSAFYFFSRGWAAVNLVVVGAAYAGVLALRPHVMQPAVAWVTTMWTLAAAGVLLLLLREHVERLVERVTGSARQAAEHGEALQAIADATREIARSVEPSTIRPAVCIGARRATNAAACALYEPTADGRGLSRTADDGAEASPDLLLFTGAPTAAGAAFSSGEQVFIGDLREHALTRERAPGVPWGSALWQPVMRGDTRIGVLCLMWNQTAAVAPRRALALVGLLAEEAAAGIERARLLATLEETARTDPLTGLPNRRAWDEALAREMARARRDERPLSVAILDLDRFKGYNDANGHLAGDRLLKELAGVWSAQVRTIDTLARFGGEEFTLAFPACTLDDSMELVQRLRSLTPGGVTCSAGLALWNGSEEAEALLERADGALYRAKQAGRDRALAG
ncbi:MAG TPA: diguanylate cyclase [Solirubrobacteraceae bacterium]|jgi:diguanylate cyclase (GGDEF)-like protein|nr:diguanylate cyclase [Solirubrobacteraceae bacterium]